MNPTDVPEATQELPVVATAVRAERAGWPPRRLVAVAVATPVLLVVPITRAMGSMTPAWIVVAAIVAMTGAAVLATYLPPPGPGARLQIGCTPCASIAVLTVPISIAVLSAPPYDLPSAFPAVGVAGFGLWQRLTDPRACPA